MNNSTAAAQSSSAPLDTLYAVQTPEGVDIEFVIAGPAARFWAWLLDLVIRGTILIGLGMIVGVLGETGNGVFLIAWFVLEWFYPIFFEIYKDGITPGKKAMHLQVVMNDGRPVDLAASVIRNLTRAADFAPAFNVAALLSMLSSKNCQRLGDIAAGTMVVYTNNIKHRTSAEGHAILPPPMKLTMEEQQGLVNYAQRSDELSAQRRQELCGHAKPLWSQTKQMRDSSPTSRLLAIARWHLGDRKGL